MTRWGTHHFVNFEAAVRYYRAYGFTRADVGRKRANGEIVTSRPPRLQAGQLWSVEGGRYFITDCKV